MQNKFTQPELQQLKSILSKQIETFENYAMLNHSDGVFYKERGYTKYKNECFATMQVYRNKAKNLAKLQKKVKDMISGKESY